MKRGLIVMMIGILVTPVRWNIFLSLWDEKGSEREVTGALCSLPHQAVIEDEVSSNSGYWKCLRACVQYWNVPFTMLLLSHVIFLSLTECIWEKEIILYLLKCQMRFLLKFSAYICEVFLNLHRKCQPDCSEPDCGEPNQDLHHQIILWDLCCFEILCGVEW